MAFKSDAGREFMHDLVVLSGSHHVGGNRFVLVATRGGPSA